MEIDQPPVGSLTDAARSRKERLRSLREGQKQKQREKDVEKGENDEKIEKKDNGNEVASADSTQTAAPLKLRNYRPVGEDLVEALMPETSLAEKQPSLALDNEDVIEDTSLLADTVDIAKLAPRKPTWDLKREIEKKMERLDRRTQRAIAELVSERLRAQSGGDMGMQVNVGATAEQLGAEQDAESDN